MSKILPTVVEILLNQGIENLYAVVNKKNIAARKVLKKAHFIYKAPFGTQQDLFEIAKR
ncbi:hypothetical protein D3C87_2174940 [compost metagenome]